MAEGRGGGYTQALKHCGEIRNKGNQTNAEANDLSTFWRVSLNGRNEIGVEESMKGIPG